MLNAIIKHRQSLHRIPEIDDELPLTFEYVNRVLQSFDCELIYPSKSAVCAYFDYGKSDAIAFRADMDALPIAEKNTHGFVSEHDGKMHACGHDAHMAMLLGFAELLSSNNQTPVHNVMLIFQPAEESIGGAEKICDSKIFQTYNIKKTYGLHVWPGLAKGEIFTKPGAFMPKCSEIDVNIKGLSTHIAKASQGKDAMVAGAKFLLEVYDMIANEQPPEVLLKFGKFLSGTAGNAISAHTYFKGSMRAFDMDTYYNMKKRVEEIAQDISEQTGCEFDIKLAKGYPPLINDEELYKEAVNKIPELNLLNDTLMTAEDFSYYGEVTPVLFSLLGLGDTPPLHSDTFDFDEVVLEKGVKFFNNILFR